MPRPVAIAEGRVLPGIRPTVLGTLSIELVVVVCAVRVEMACVRARCVAAATRHARVMLRAGARSVSASRIGILRHDVGPPRRTGVRHAARSCYCHGHGHQLRALLPPATGIPPPALLLRARPPAVTGIAATSYGHSATSCLSVSPSLSLCLSVPRSLCRL